MWNKWNLTERLLEGLRKNEAENIDEIHIVDNGSEFPNEVKDLNMWGAYYNSVCFNVYVHRLERNLGFTLGANHGLKSACKYTEERDLIFLISNDVQINGKFIEQAESVLLQPNPALVGNRHINFDSGWNLHGEILYDYLEGYFLATTKLGWQELGFFDPNYAPYDAEDIDLSTTAKKKGYKLVSLNNPNVVHQNGGTIGFNPERERITKRNMGYFKNKWAG
jgi:GT2 family glycosyltransferase